MKKLTSLVLILLLTIGLSACGDKENTDQPDPIDNQEQQKELRDDERVDIMQDFNLEGIEYQEATRKFTLHSYIDDSMVLQQQKEIRLVGKGEPNTLIMVKLTKDLDQRESYKNLTTVQSDGKWEVILPAIEASYFTYTLTINNGFHEQLISDILIGEVWIMSGQSNMELKVQEMNKAEFTFGSINEEYIRVFNQRVGDNNANFSYTPLFDVQMGYWEKAISYDVIKDCSGIGFTFAYNLFYDFISQGKQVPVAIINTAKGGSKIQSWLPREEVEASIPLKDFVTYQGYTWDDSEWNTKEWDNYQQVSALYNHNIAPLSHFNIKGVVWYQGESDPYHLQNIFTIKTMVDSWSKKFNRNDELLDFALIQLHPYDGRDPIQGPSTINYDYAGFSAHRRAQFDVVMDEDYENNVTLVPIYDIDLSWDVPTTQYMWQDPIHPTTKIPVGERVADIIMSFSYLDNEENLAPLYDSLEVTSNSITITFKNVGEGLKLFKDETLGVTTLEVVSTNGTRTTVTGEIISSNQVQISNIDTSDIKYVQYSNFMRNEESNLGNMNGIPAVPFVVKVD